MEQTLRLTDDAEKRLRRGYEMLYFSALFCVLAETYISITMFQNQSWVIPFVSVVRTVSGCLLPLLMGVNVIAMGLSLFKKCPSSFAYTAEQVIVALTVGGVLLVPYGLYGYREPLWFAVFIIGAHRIDGKKILRFYFWVSAVWCGLTFFCGITGIIENLIYYRVDGTRRISFGFVYPTDCCSHLFFLAVCWLWLKEEKTTIWQLVVIAALGVFAYFACDARTSAITLLLLAGWMAVVKWRSRKTDGRYRMIKPLQWGCVAAPWLGAALMTVASVFYDENNRWLSLLDKLTSTRLSLGHEGFSRYRLTLFGQSVVMNGNGGSVMVPEDYFFLDCSYINLLLRYGLVPLLLVLAILLYLTLNEKSKKAFVHVGLIGIVALQCVIEHHLMEIGHAPLLLLLLACDGTSPNGFSLWKRRSGTPQKTVS